MIIKISNEHPNLKQVAKKIFIKTKDREFTEYIISEIETEQNAIKILDWIDKNPDWGEREMIRKVLFIAGVLKNDYL